MAQDVAGRKIECDCMLSLSVNEHIADFSSFEKLRQKCAALHSILIPNDDWKEYKKFCTSCNETQASGIMWLAYQRGYLSNLTKPIHEFILKATITKQYRKDLTENWFLKNNPFKASCKFQGRLAELRFAFWLRQNEWHVSSLEAYGGNFDTEAQSPEGTQSFFEVKYLNVAEECRSLAEQSLLNDCIIGGLSPCSRMDYLLLRAYEAAVKLDQASNQNRIAVLILEDYFPFERLLKNRWIEWESPKLGKEQNIKNFLEEKFKGKYSDVELDLGTRIKSLQQIWIFRNTSSFDLERKFVINPATEAPLTRE